MPHSFQCSEPIQRALDFVRRTQSHGAPLRVALIRAERRFGVDRSMLRALLQSQEDQ